MRLREGLAVYVTKTAFPNQDELYWTYLSSEYYSRCNTRIKEFAGRMLADLEMPAYDFDRKYFRPREDTDELPPRCGYLIGYRAVEKIITKKPLNETLSMTSQEYRPLLIKAFQEISQK